MSTTVLIASAQHLSQLKAQIDADEAIAFADNEALQALDTITRKRPEVIALERQFASTSRGAALINRIKADPGLAACEIRIVAHDAAPAAARPTARAPEPAPAPTAAAAADVDPDRKPMMAEPAPPAVASQPLQLPNAPLDQRGTRRSPRFRIVEDVEVSIDGNPATLVDLSIVGAMVVSPTILRPNQRVRVLLPQAARAIRFSGGVAWASFEMGKGMTQYRAGIEFFDADAAAVQQFLDEKKL